MKHVTFISFIVLSFLFSSCYYNSRLVYLQGSNATESRPATLALKKPVYRLQSADVISVKVKGSTEAESSNAIFNLASGQNGGFNSPSMMFLEGYTVDSKGNIKLPIIGETMVKGLTIEEAQQLIQTSANKFLNKSTVIVNLTSFKVTVLGEVKNPGYLYVYNSQATILEILGLAGDLTPYANRKNVKLIRQISPSSQQIVMLDLTDAKLLSSDYFILMPNDVIYVEPLKARSEKTNLEILSVVFGGLTTAILILNYVNSN